MTTKTKKEYAPPVFIGQNLYVKPSYVVSIPEYYKENGSCSVLELQNQENLLDNDHNGKLSRKAVTGLRNSINWLCLAAKKKRVFNKTENKNFYFKINFITLTLPDTKEPILSTDLQKKLLNPFLTYMRKYHGLKNYVWRLEFQANGKLHVHLTSDTFLHHVTIRETWNRLLEKNDYLELFYNKNGHMNPNSTDVHATKKIKNMAAYLAKYMSKKNSMYKEKEVLIHDLVKKVSEFKNGKALVNFEKSLRHKLTNDLFKNNGMRGNYAIKKGWYFQRLNFWNSPFNPRPISGRIWSCSAELSKANKSVVHIAANEMEQLKCLMRSDIEYKEIHSPAPKTIHAQFAPNDWRNQPRKIGEVYFLKAMDWYSKITGALRQKFEQTRESLANLITTYTFELA